MRLIDWDKVLEWMHRQKETLEQWSMRIAIENYVDEMPTVDAEPVRHGKWVIEPDRTVMHCNACGWAFEYYAGLEEEWNYCPHCGAKIADEMHCSRATVYNALKPTIKADIGEETEKEAAEG